MAYHGLSRFPSCDLFAKVKFLLEKPAWDSMLAARKAGTCFELPKGNGKQKTGPLPMFFAPDEFKPHTAAGKKIIQKYVMAMKSDFESIHHKLVDQNGEANFFQTCRFLIWFDNVWYIEFDRIWILDSIVLQCSSMLLVTPCWSPVALCRYARGMHQS